jgi:hypothetical protein
MNEIHSLIDHKYAKNKYVDIRDRIPLCAPWREGWFAAGLVLQELPKGVSKFTAKSVPEFGHTS